MLTLENGDVLRVVLAGKPFVNEGTGDSHLILLSFMPRGEPVHIPNKSALFHCNSSCEPAAGTLQVTTNMSSGHRWATTVYELFLRQDPAPRERAPTRHVNREIVSMTETYHDTGKCAGSHKNGWIQKRWGACGTRRRR